MCCRPPSHSDAVTRPRRVLAATLAAGLAFPVAAVAQAPPAERSAVERFELVLGAAVSRVSRAQVLPLLGGTGSARGFSVPGVGIVFVLPTQALPAPRRALVVRRGPSGPGSAPHDERDTAERARLEVESLRQAREAALEEAARHGEESAHVAQAEEAHQQARAAARAALASQRDLERELREVEELARAYQRDVERMSGQAERALSLLTQALREGRREIRVPLEPVAAAAPPEVPPTPPPTSSPPGPPAPTPTPAPLAPWRYWFEVDDEKTATPVRSPRDPVHAVREVVLDVIEGQGPLLHTLRPDDLIVVAVDFVPPAVAVGAPEISSRRLVIKARKRDLDDHRSGRLATVQLRARIEAIEY